VNLDVLKGTAGWSLCGFDPRDQVLLAYEPRGVTFRPIVFGSDRVARRRKVGEEIVDLADLRAGCLVEDPHGRSTGGVSFTEVGAHRGISLL
jgi:hypothetical protein